MFWHGMLGHASLSRDDTFWLDMLSHDMFWHSVLDYVSLCGNDMYWRDMLSHASFSADDMYWHDMLIHASFGVDDLPPKARFHVITLLNSKRLVLQLNAFWDGFRGGGWEGKGGGVVARHCHNWYIERIEPLHYGHVVAHPHHLVPPSHPILTSCAWSWFHTVITRYTWTGLEKYLLRLWCGKVIFFVVCRMFELPCDYVLVSVNSVRVCKFLASCTVSP